MEKKAFQAASVELDVCVYVTSSNVYNRPERKVLFQSHRGENQGSGKFSNLQAIYVN